MGTGQIFFFILISIALLISIKLFGKKGSLFERRSYIKIFQTNIYGVTRRTEDGKSRQKFIREDLTMGQWLYLEREPDNSYDKNAVKVYTKSWVDIGYIPKERNNKLAELMDNGYDCRAQVMDITGGTWNKENFGIVVDVFRQEIVKPKDQKRATTSSSYNLNKLSGEDNTPKRNLTGGTKKRLLNGVESLISRNNMNFDEYKVAHLKRDVENGSLRAQKGVGKATVDELKKSLQNKTD